MRRNITILLFFGIAFCAFQTTPASPLTSRANFRSSLTGSSYNQWQCPSANAKCGSIFFNLCDNDRDCNDIRGLANFETVGCCHIPCKEEKYCVRLEEKTHLTTSQPNVTCQKCSQKNIVFLVDGTVTYNNNYRQAAKDFQEIKKFVTNILERLGCAKFRVAVMQFGGKRDARTEVLASGDDTRTLIKAVHLMEQMKGYERRLGEALAAASNKLYEMETLSDNAGKDIESSPPGVVVVITSGKAKDLKQTREEIRMMNLKRVHVLSIAVGPYADSLINYLQKETACVPSDVITARYNELPQRVNNIAGRICLDFERICAAPVACGKYDIYLVVDGSASVKYKVFDKKRKLITDLLVLLNNSPNSDIHVGLMQFSEKNLTKEFVPLGKNTLPYVKAVVNRMEYQHGQRTMLGDALRRIGQVFDGSGGDRSNAGNKLIVFTDGVAHDLRVAKMQAEKLKHHGVEVITVSVGGRSPVLKEIASKHKALNERLTSLAETAEYADRIDQLICY